MRQTWWMLMVLGFFVGGCSHKPTAPEASEVQEANGPEESADSPDNAVRRLEAALRAGDHQAYLAVMAREYRDKFDVLKLAIQANETASDAFVQALEARFGKDPQFSPIEHIDFDKLTPVAGAHLEILSRTEEDEGRLRLKLRMTRSVPTGAEAEEPEMTAVHDPDGWKLIPSGASADSSAAFFDKNRKAYEQISADLRAGKFSSRTEAMQAWLAAMQ